MTVEYEAAMLRTLNGSLNDLLVRMSDWHSWLISYCDTRTVMRPDAEVYLLVGHRSVRNGNPLARIDTCEVQRIEQLPGGKCRTYTENGYRITVKTEDFGEEARDAYEVMTARDTIAALYGIAICHHADALESEKRSANEPR